QHHLLSYTLLVPFQNRLHYFLKAQPSLNQKLLVRIFVLFHSCVGKRERLFLYVALKSPILFYIYLMVHSIPLYFCLNNSHPLALRMKFNWFRWCTKRRTVIRNILCYNCSSPYRRKSTYF